MQYRAYELTHLSHIARAKMFITAGRIGPRRAAAEIAGLRDKIPSLQVVAAFGPSLPDEVIGLDERIALADDLRGLRAHLGAWSPDPNDCVTICWTSGTESTPKGVQRTHYDWMAMCTSAVEGPDRGKGPGYQLPGQGKGRDTSCQARNSSPICPTGRDKLSLAAKDLGKF